MVGYSGLSAVRVPPVRIGTTRYTRGTMRGLEEGYVTKYVTNYPSQVNSGESLLPK
jgi:hypothetical protein